jgi:hypothetical protein
VVAEYLHFPFVLLANELLFSINTKMLFPALSKVCLIDALDYGEMVTIFGAKGKSISFPHLKCVHGFLSFSSDSKLKI